MSNGDPAWPVRQKRLVSKWAVASVVLAGVGAIVGTVLGGVDMLVGAGKLTIEGYQTQQAADIWLAGMLLSGLVCLFGGVLGLAVLSNPQVRSRQVRGLVLATVGVSLGCVYPLLGCLLFSGVI